MGQTHQPGTSQCNYSSCHQGNLPELGSELEQVALELELEQVALEQVELEWGQAELELGQAELGLVLHTRAVLVLAQPSLK